MQISPKIKRQLRWQNTFFVVLFLAIIIILGVLSVRYEFEADWTNNQRNTPSNETLALLEKITEPVSIKAFVSSGNKTLASDIKHLVKTYQRFNKDITFNIIDPLREPELVRELGIRNEGELALSFKGRTELVQVASEQNLTNAIQRLARTKEQWVLFLEGHNERDPFGDTNFDFSAWTQVMKAKGLNVRAYNLGSNPEIPVNTSLLVIADPQKSLLPGEILIILDYIERGGNLLWLIEPNEIDGLEAISETLGLETLPGMVVDPNTQLLGINDPRFTLIPEYPRNPITTDLDTMTIFPTAKAFEYFDTEDWETDPILETLPRSWSETEEFTNDITMDDSQDIPGPLLIGLSLTRTKDDGSETDEVLISPLEEEILDSTVESETDQQRIIVIGDNDFASDAYIGQAGNLDFSMRLINWLVKDDSFISIPSKNNLDMSLQLSKTSQVIIGFGFLLVIPLSLLLTGLAIWYRRRKR